MSFGLNTRRVMSNVIIRIYRCINKLWLHALYPLALVMSVVATAQADTGKKVYQAPKFDFLRFNEDWSSLKGVAIEDLEPIHRIKHISLSEDGSNWVSLGGHLRARSESYQDFAFGAPADANDSFIVYRALFHADWHFGENLRIFSELKHADISGRDLPGGARPIDEDPAEIQQLFVDYQFTTGTDSSFTLRVGRQEYGFGKSRLISPLPWANALRHWDGVTGIFNTPKYNVNAFYSSFNPVDQDGFNNNDSDNTLAGIYIKQDLATGGGVEYYWLGTEREDIAFNGTLGDEERDTFGIRHWGEISDPLGYEFEVAYQTGNVGVEDVSAYMFASELAYAFPGANSSKLSLGFDFASGDEDAGGEVNTFNQLFPLGHAYFGFIDTVGRQNIVDISAAYTAKASDRSNFRIAVHNFSRAEDEDALYNAGGAVVRAGDANASSDIGNEIDLTFSYSFTKRATGSLGYSQFFAGDFLSDTGADEDIQFAFAQILYNF